MDGKIRKMGVEERFGEMALNYSQPFTTLHLKPLFLLLL
jgi:hypothetical protein